MYENNFGSLRSKRFRTSSSRKLKREHEKEGWQISRTLSEKLTKQAIILA